jgi:heme-degrading monooxygenase HmoA
MYLAMNRFHVPLDNATAFETLWLSRDSKLTELPGFVAFHLLKGPESEGAILYASHTVWESEAHFRAWTRSDQFRTAHGRAGETRQLYRGTPAFEGFIALQHISAQPAAAQPAAAKPAN